MKIIKPGKKIFEIDCPRCGAILAYEKEDVKMKEKGEEELVLYITCPCCGNNIPVKEG